jgi:ATP-dependent helicase/nuclease subunit B
VEIMSLEDSRFVKKRYKYFINFTEDNYPSIKVNPFLFSLDDQGISMSKLSEKISRRNLFISMIFAENIVFTYARAQLNGDPIVPSPYEKEMRQSFKNVCYSEKFLFKKGNLPKDPENIFSDAEATIYYILNGKKEFLQSKHHTDIERLKKEITNPGWQLYKNTDLGRLSHTKITTYVDCPFKYYLGIEGRLNGDKDFEKFFDGLIKHRVMKEIFSKYKNYEVMSQKILNEEELKEEIKNIIEDVWEEYTDDFLHTYEAIKDVESEIITEDILESIEDIHRKYVHFKKGIDLTYSQVIATELEVNSKINIGNFHDVDLTSRIDRVDLLNGNYSYFLDEFDDQLLPGAYSIMDYKRSKNFQSEQLLIYYLTLLNNEEWKNKLANTDVYLKFQVVSKKKDHKNSNFIKIQKGKIIYKKHKARAKYVSFDINEFYRWLEKVFQNINKSNFTPIAVKERQIRRFLEEMHDKYNNAKTGEKYYDCSSCQFRSLCELMQYKKDFIMNIKKYF